MHSNKKPRSGVSRNSEETKNKPARQSFRIPKGFPGAGKFTTREAVESFYLPEIAERRRQEKLAHDRETRKAARARRQALMLNKKECLRKYPDQASRFWGETATGPLREKTKYGWHGALVVTSNSEAVIQKAGLLAGSDMSVKTLSTKTGAGYQIVLTPYFGRYTPAEAEREIPDHMAQMQRDFERMGAEVIPLGAMWRR